MKRFLHRAVIATVACAAMLAGCGKDKEPPVPVITIGTQPTAPPSAFVEGSVSGTLTVAASATEGAALTFQWYSNTTASNTGGTTISGAKSASYSLPGTLTAGIYYYFCEVGAQGAKAVRTNVVTVTVVAKPVITITTQPTGVGPFIEGAIPADTRLTVAASVTEGAALKYQWYRYDPDNDEIFEAIEGATAANYTIPTDLAPGEHWYVCEVGVAGDEWAGKTEPKQTDPVAVTVTGKLTVTDDAKYDIPAMTVGTAISPVDVSDAVSGGTAPYKYTATGLPAGIAISEAGVISGTPAAAGAAGTATITVTDSTTPTAQTQSITIAYGVTTVSVTGVTLNKTKLSLTEGDTEKLTATVAPDNATNKAVTWKSSATSIATVDAETGKVTAVKAGTATITVTTADGNKTATCAVTVTAADDIGYPGW